MARAIALMAVDIDTSEGRIALRHCVRRRSQRGAASDSDHHVRLPHRGPRLRAPADGDPPCPTGATSTTP